MEMGFVFGYNGTLGDSESVDISQIDKIDRRKRNHDDTFLSVRCDGCDTYMDFYPGVKDDLDGYWECPICNEKVDEINIYQKLNDENEAHLRENDLI
jgi:rubredoxin